MFLLAHVFIAYFTVACQAFSQLVLDRLNVSRGIQDRFTIVNCQGNCSCNHLEACCADGGCLTCECHGNYPTFHPEKGRCVKNEEFAFSVDDNHSFLMHKRQHEQCMYPLDEIPYVTAGKPCDIKNITQHWIWTSNNRLLNLFNLKCLGTSNVTSEVPGRGKFPRVALDFCNGSDSGQFWQCEDGDKGLFFLRNNNKLYLSFGYDKQYVLLFNSTGFFSQWRRYQNSNSFKSICANVSSYGGCYKYTDGSTMLTLGKEDLDDCMLDNSNKQQCVKEKDIQAPIEITNHQCFIQWKTTQFLNYTVWDQLPFTDTSDIFSLGKKQIGILKLKIYLAKVSTKWHGQIIKLFIRCDKGSQPGPGAVNPPVQTTKETHCVLIKFSGKFETLYRVYETSTPATNEHEKATQSSSNSERRSSTVVIVVVVCLLIVFLTVGGIIGYWFYKRKRHQSKKCSSARTMDNKADVDPPVSYHGAESLNPIYSPDETKTQDTKETYQEPTVGAKSECGLYEPDVDHVYNYIDLPTASRGANEVPPQSQSYTYDYATNDDVSLKSQQSHLKKHDYENSEVKNN